MTSDEIDEALDDEYWCVRYDAICCPNAQPHHIDIALNDEDLLVRLTAYHHQLTTDDQKIEYKLRCDGL